MAAPIALLFLLWSLIITPFDYFKYKTTRYYKDTHEKYSWLCASSYYIKFYDLIKKGNFPIEYFRCDSSSITGYGYFIYKDILIINDYEPCYDAEKGIWTVEIEDEYVDIRDDAAHVIEQCNNFLKKDVCKKGVILIDDDLLQACPSLESESIKFVSVVDGDLCSALKTVIEQSD